MPLSFEPNEGQASPSARFVAHARGAVMAFTSSGVSVSVIAADQGTGQQQIAPAVAPAAQAALAQRDQQQPLQLDLQLEFLDTQPGVQLREGPLMSGKVNYMLGNDRSQWHTDLPTYSSIAYTELYPGISLRYEGDGRLLKGTYTVAPGADAGAIHWRYQGAGALSVDADGNLRIAAGKEDKLSVSEQAPVAWQMVNGQRVPVTARYDLAADGSVRFALGPYDKALPLTIDPTIVYSTYLGGDSADQTGGLATDAAGNAYVTGYTASSDFPTVNAFQPSYGGFGDVFVAKFDPSGQPIYITYLGGGYLDWGQKIAADGEGNAYITGWTGSTNFPVLNAFQPTYAGGWDAFVTKLNPSGSALVYSTYLGGSGQEDRVNAGTPGGIAVDTAGNAYVTGDTQSSNFPVVNAYRSTLSGPSDAFLTKFGPSGTVAYSTYFGGEGNESAFGIAVDQNGNPVITGDTTSSYLPVQNAYQPECHRPSYVGCWDAFVTKFNADGSGLIFSTYLGGNDQFNIDRGFGITVDAAGNTYATGMTGSPDFPLLNPYQGYAGQEDIWIAKFGTTGTLILSTLLGGSNSDVGYDIAANSAGNFYVTGLTLSEDYPTVNPIQPSLAGTEDPVLTKFSPDGQSLVYSTYFGGSNGREEWGATGIGLDASNNVYIAGLTEATNFPILNAYQPTNHGSYDAFITKFADTTLPPSPTPTVCGTSYGIQPSTGATIVPGVDDIGNHCASCVTQIMLPFPFTLYAQTYTMAYIGTGGTIRFQDEFIPTINQCLPADLPQQALLPYWDDLITSPQGDGIYTSVSGSAPNRIFNIEWRAHYGTDPVHFEVRLYENSPNGQFDFIYGETSNLGSGATVGVQEDRFGRYTQYSCDSPVLISGLKLTFTLDDCTTGTPVPPTSTTVASSTSTSTVMPSETSTRPPSQTPVATGTQASTSTPSPSATQAGSATSTPTLAPTTGTPVPLSATPTICPIQFTDVPPGSTFYPFVRCLACRGIINGYPCGGPGEPCDGNNDPYFRAGNPVTRGQLSKIVSNSAGFSDAQPDRLFEDVAVGSTFHDFIGRLATRGYISGYPCGGPGEPCGVGNLPYFRPNNNASRGQISKIDSNAALFNEDPTGQQFEDVQMGSTYYTYTYRLVTRAIMSGYPCGGAGEPCGPGNLPYFRPNNNATRGQTSKIVSNTFFPECIAR
jgi:hypothetical protein